MKIFIYNPLDNKVNIYQVQPAFGDSQPIDENIIIDSHKSAIVSYEIIVPKHLENISYIICYSIDKLNYIATASINISVTPWIDIPGYLIPLIIGFLVSQSSKIIDELIVYLKEEKLNTALALSKLEYCSRWVRGIVTEDNAIPLDYLMNIMLYGSVLHNIRKISTKKKLHSFDEDVVRLIVLSSEYNILLEKYEKTENRTMGKKEEIIGLTEKIMTGITKIKN